MKSGIRHLSLAFAVTVWFAPGTCRGAEAPAPAQPAAAGPVGDLGARQAIRLEGNHTFTSRQILDALELHLDVQLAAHRRAPLADYTTRIGREIALGYQRAGFPEVAVTAAADTNAHRIRVQIAEGPRFRCGDILLSGVPTMTNAAVLQKIRDRLGGGEPGSAGSTNMNAVLWAPNGPAAFDTLSQASLKTAVQEVLADLAYFQPKVSVSIVPDPTLKLAQLRVEIADEGVKGAIEQIEVSGLRANTRQGVLDYLDLHPGMPPQARLVDAVSAKLRDSGRFLHHDVRLTPLAQVGQFKLELDLEELPSAPPLNRELSPREQAMLKFGDWLRRWQERPEDLVVSFSATNSPFDAQVVLSPAGVVFAARQAPTGGTSALAYALVASERNVGLYSVWRQRKFVLKPSGTEVTGSFRVQAASASRNGNPFNAMIGLGAGNRAKSHTGPPIRFESELPPVLFLYEADVRGFVGVLENDRWTMSIADAEEGTETRLQIEAATGRLIQATSRAGSVVMQAHSEEGAFARLVGEIAATTATHRNECVNEHELSSGLAFLLADLVESPFTDRVLEAVAARAAENPSRTNVLAALQRLKPELGRLRALLGQVDLAKVFEPLNQLFPAAEDNEDADPFFVPLDNVSPGAESNAQMAVVAAWLLGRIDGLLARDSWPWVLARETCLTVAGQSRYTRAELESLLQSGEMGPVGCLATALLLGRVDARQARTFAEQGRERTTLAAFRWDYDLMLGGDTLASQVLANGIRLLGNVNPEQLQKMMANLRLEDAAFLRELTARLHEAKEQPLGAALWPVVEPHWDAVVRPRLEAGLNHFLPQAQFLTDPAALYARGRALLAPDAVMADVNEAAECFRKAADQGHGGAQLWLGILYAQGNGVPQDFAEAMRWFREALDKKEPHASCRIADLYRDGKGVKADLDEAARWYRQEAERGCTGAQFNLGRICEIQRNYAEALTWYRRAAEAGQVAAQVQLAELLSDGFTVPADYAEACQWLMLVARDGSNRVVQVELRRVKSKLTPEQVEEAQRRADAIADRLESQKRAGNEPGTPGASRP